MREAAEMIAQQSDTYAPSLATRIGWIFRRIWSVATRHARARRDLAQLRSLDHRGLADLGLAPEDLNGLDDHFDADAALRRLNLVVERRTSAWARVDEERRVSPEADRSPADLEAVLCPVPAT